MERKRIKTKIFKRVLALALVTAMGLSACGQKSVSNTSESQKIPESNVTSESNAGVEAEATVDKDKLPVITLYPGNASLYSGLVTGHRADYFADLGFQVEVWAYSDEKTTAMLTSGDLPDMMYICTGGTEMLETLITTGKIINYEDYKDKLPNFFENPYCEYVEANLDIVRERYSAGTNGLYVLPSALGVRESKQALAGTFDRGVIKLKWDVYEQIGAPEITDLWQLLDVVEQMVDAQPTAEDGTKTYGTVLDNGVDTESFGCLQLWYAWHGYNNDLFKFYGEVDMINGTVESIFEDDSLYKEGLKWYNEMYRRDLLDPDSVSTSRADQVPKIDNGLAMLPAGTLPGWAPTYYEVFVPGTTVYFDFDLDELTYLNNCIVINAETDHLEECLSFVNMMADLYAQLNIRYGPEGDIWKADGNVLSLTKEFVAWLKENGSMNGFLMSDGTEWSDWNTSFAAFGGLPIPGYTDINGNPIVVFPRMWADYQAITNDNDNWNAWKETMKAESLWDYCEKNNITVHQSTRFDGVPWPVPNENQTLTIATIKDVVVPASWQMVYSESEEEFEQLWDQMVEDAMALGAQDIIDWLIESYVPNN